MNRLHHWYCRSAHWRSTLERLLPWAIEDLCLGDHLLDLGSGPGVATPMLKARTTRVTAIDTDRMAVAALRSRTVGGVDIVRGDATNLPFPASTFSAAVSFAMLHHIPTAALQDQLFREVARTLRPGGAFVSVDARFSPSLWLFHLGDTFAPLVPETVGSRLAAAGFRDIAIEVRSEFFRFSGCSSNGGLRGGGHGCPEHR